MQTLIPGPATAGLRAPAREPDAELVGKPEGAAHARPLGLQEDNRETLNPKKVYAGWSWGGEHEQRKRAARGVGGAMVSHQGASTPERATSLSHPKP